VILSAEEQKLLRRRKRRAAGMLKLTVSPKVHTFIRGIKEPAAIWKFLNDKYNTFTIADAMALRNKWTALKMTDNMDVSSFMQAISETLNDLKNAGVEIDNDTTVHKILTELPQKLEIFVRTVQQETRMPSLDNLGARLHLEESNIKLRAGNISEEALIMRIRNVVRQGRGRYLLGAGSYNHQPGSSSNNNQPQPYGTRQEPYRLLNSNR
jgi:hypothetical protein